MPSWPNALLRCVDILAVYISQTLLQFADSLHRLWPPTPPCCHGDDVATLCHPSVGVAVLSSDCWRDGDAAASWSSLPLRSRGYVTSEHGLPSCMNVQLHVMGHSCSPELTHHPVSYCSWYTTPVILWATIHLFKTQIMYNIHKRKLYLVAALVLISNPDLS